jgi:hypothetical protein
MEKRHPSRVLKASNLIKTRSLYTSSSFYHLSVCGRVVRNVSYEALEISTMPMWPV